MGNHKVKKYSNFESSRWRSDGQRHRKPILKTIAENVPSVVKSYFQIDSILKGLQGTLQSNYQVKDKERILKTSREKA